jgi:dihydrofolate synthase/folylpolyglutamate synthase
LNYNECIEYIHSTHKFGIKLGLDNIKRLLELLGNPQEHLKFVHIAGTNGKGSTASFVYNILIEAGLKTGLFISPYIICFNERIQINREYIKNNELIEVTEKVKAAIEIMQKENMPHPTEFEVVTAIAMLYYYNKKCDFVVLEVGLGGRFDSTNIIEKPVLGIITRISLDHTDILGNTIEKIAYEKGGIIKENSINLIYPQKKEAEAVLSSITKDKKAKLIKCSFDKIKILEHNLYEQVFDYDEWKNLKIHMLGRYQINNAVMAVNAISILKEQGFLINTSCIRNGLLKTRWPCRLEVVRKKPFIIMDGSHNVEGVNTVIDFINENFDGKDVIFVFAMMKDKEYKEAIKLLSTKARGFVLVDLDLERALPVKKARKIVKYYCNDVMFSGTIRETSKYICSLKEDEVVFVVGSFYYLGELREELESEV